MRRLDHQAGVLLVFSTLLGLGIRLAIVAPAGFPLNDGGLFYKMITDLAANQLRLPAYTTYNSASIPFAYPPLVFYFYAALHLAMHLPVLALMQYGPALISAASIPAFFLFVSEMLASRSARAVATLIYALLPRAFDWLIMGGGVTRSFGLLFALLAMWQSLRLFREHQWRVVVAVAFFAALVVATHPEAAVHTAIATSIFYLWTDRSRAGLVQGAAAATGAVVLTAPWWATVLARHGLEPFLAVAQAARADGYGPIGTLLSFFRFDFADEPFIALLTVLGLVGLASELSRKNSLLPAWIIVTYLLEPRGAPTFVMIPLAMCAALGLTTVILPALPSHVIPGTPSPERRVDDESGLLEGLVDRRAAWLTLSFVTIYAAVSAYAIGWRVRELSLRSEDLQAMEWVRENTALGSRFALITQQLPLRDASSEWFPAVTDRISVATVFGAEWLTQPNFAEVLRRYRDLQACAQRDAECLRDWSTEYALQPEYVYIADPVDIGNVALARFLEGAPRFQEVYQSKTVAIFAWR